MSQLLQRSLHVRSPVAIRGEGIFLTLDDGRRIIDATGGAAVACLGHGSERVIDAMAAQARRLSYAHTGFFTSEPAEALAAHLVGDAPGGLSHAFFVSSGSEAMEAAIKLARQYFVEKGETERFHLIARRQSYHGATLGALALGGHVGRRAPHEPMLSAVMSQISPCFALHGRRADESDAGYVLRLAAELDAEFERLGPHRVIGFCAETVVGATLGCAEPVPGYLAAMKGVCRRHGALFILDEIMCGMGRCGTLHAWEPEGVTPDIQAIGKGLGGGYQPIGALLVARDIVEGLARGTGNFVHGQTYQAHPVACAAALEVQQIIAEEELVCAVQVRGAQLISGLRAALAGHAHIADVRGRGLFVGIELAEDAESLVPFDPSLRMNERFKQAALDQGLGVYPGAGTIDGLRGDHILLAPPFNSDAAIIDEIVGRFVTAVDQLFGAERLAIWSNAAALAGN